MTITSPQCFPSTGPRVRIPSPALVRPGLYRRLNDYRGCLARRRSRGGVPMRQTTGACSPLSLQEFNPKMTTTPIENYTPLPQAAKRLKVTATVLQRLIDNGMIRAARLGGTVAVAESELNQTITREQFEHLRGQAITIPQAAETYQVNPETLRGWVRLGYIRILKDGYAKELDLADVEYCVAVYLSQGGGRGKRIFDKSGLPYQMKHTEWADYQRERRKKKIGPLGSNSQSH
jgi:excisionase family DNA binding protein